MHTSLSTWLRSRDPAPPDDLARRMDAMTRAVASRAAEPTALLDAAEQAITTLLDGGCLTREAGLELLAVDALVTYAFEAAADDPDQIDASARAALVRIAGLAARYDS